MNDHPFRSEYTVPFGALGFRAPFNFPDAAPEDSFFIAPSEIKLIETDATRDSGDIHRAGRVDNYVAGSSLGNIPVLIFSWHLWDRVPWNRRKNTLFDHYAHCVRRFDQPEHD